MSITIFSGTAIIKILKLGATGKFFTRLTVSSKWNFLKGFMFSWGSE